MLTTTLRRLAWPRFRLRTLLLVPVACALALYVDDRRAAYWVGQRPVAIRWVVVDAETQEPLEDAQVTVYDLSGASRGPLHVISTNARGKCEIVEKCTAAGKDSLFRHSGSVRLPWWYFQVTRKGYLDTDYIPLVEQARTWRLDLSDPRLPAMKVELRTKSRTTARRPRR